MLERYNYHRINVIIYDTRYILSISTSNSLGNNSKIPDNIFYNSLKFLQYVKLFNSTEYNFCVEHVYVALLH